MLIKGRKSRYCNFTATDGGWFRVLWFNTGVRSECTGISVIVPGYPSFVTVCSLERRSGGWR